MKITAREVLIKSGSLPNLKPLLDEIETAIAKVTWPTNNDTFNLNPTPKGNGVKPIKNACMSHLKSKGWELEKRLKMQMEMNPGPVDAVKNYKGLPFALEWETGNISSSHRAVNKIVLGMLERAISGGILILPSRNMYKYLTDRVGNFQELKPYFNVWKNFNIKDGFLAIIEIEHDSTDINAPLIPKGRDGWAEIKK